MVLSPKQECLLKLFCTADAKKWKMLPGSNGIEKTGRGETNRGRPRR